MAQIVKRCDCPRARWGKCPHSWTVRWWGTDGRQHEKSFKRNHKLAAEHARRIEAEKLSVHRGSPLPDDPVSLQSYAEQWLAGLTTPNTVRAYGSALRNHVLPQHGSRSLTEVAADREGMQALLRSLSPGMARVALTALRAMLTEATAGGRITGDRLTGLRAGDLDPIKFQFPSHAQVLELADGMGELGPAVWIMRGCGLRPAEVLAVRGDRFAGGRLRISEQQLADGTRARLKARKPGDFRDVPVPGYAARAVRDLGGGYLFSVPSRTFSGRFRKAADAAGLKGFRAHDLRHVFASVALSNGVPVTDVSRWLGHRSIEITYRTYAHYTPSSFDRAIEVLDAEYQDWSAGGVLREP
jgi:integrase